MSGTWLAFDIGCIECGEDSGVIGTFATEAEADAAALAAYERHRDAWRGQHHMAVFDLSDPESFSRFAKDGAA